MSVAVDGPNETHPYADAYGIYVDDSHWPGVLPIGFDKDKPPQPARKGSPPTGYTGDDGAWPTSDQLDTWANQHPQLNIGLRLPSDIIGLDVDHYISAKTGEIKQGGDLLTRLETEHGPLPPTWRSTSRGASNPSGVRLYRVPAGTRLVTALLGGIEVIQRHHRYAVVWPSTHPDPDPDTGQPRTYRWYTPSGDLADQPPAYDADDIPDLPWAWIGALTAAPPPQVADNPPAGPQHADEPTWSPKVRDYHHSALLRLSAASHGGRHDSACAAAMGLCRLEQLGSRGATTALDHYGATFVDRVASDRADHARNNGHVIAQREWDDIVRTGRTKAMTTASTAVDPIVELVGPATAPARSPDAPTTTAQAPESHLDKLRSALLTTDAIRDLPPPDHLIAGYLNRNSLATLYGPSGGGKTFLALDWALHVATGSWWNRANTKAGPVLYVIAEGATGIGKRLDAWQTRHQLYHLNDYHPVTWLPRAINLAEPIDVHALRAVTEELAPSLIVIDTLARCTVGVEENSAKDMGVVVANLDLIRRATEACVLTIHHSGKDAANGARGSSALRAAMDTEIELVGTDSNLLVKVTKQKDGPEPSPFWLARKTIGESLVLVPASEAPYDDGLSGKDLEALEALRQIEVPGGVSKGDWKAACGLIDRTFLRCRVRLVEAGHVENVGSEAQPRYRTRSDIESDNF